MGTLIQLPQIPSQPALHYYRATPLARLPGMCEAMSDRSAYLHDLLMLCLRGAWDRELRQFLPPASLRSSVETLLALGLIERVDDVPPPAPPERPRRLVAASRARATFAAQPIAA